MLEKIPYCKDSSGLFARFAYSPWAIYLDSGYPKSNYGRYDILSFEPEMTFQTMDGITQVTDQNGIAFLTQQNPFDVIKAYLKPEKQNLWDLPFTGGMIGYFSYDLARTTFNLANTSFNDCTIPEMKIGLYNQAIVVDHMKKEAWYFNKNGLSFEALLKKYPSYTSCKKELNTNHFRLTSNFLSNMTITEYNNSFEKIKNYISAGDCYQVNFSQRFSANFLGHPWDAYLKLRNANPSPYAAFLNFPETQILSFSPEQFLMCNNGMVTTKPIKGTKPRHPNPKIDEKNKTILQNSQKDKAENLMIVDLLRNDLGKVCEFGSIQVSNLFHLESFKNVHHLVSTVVGRLRENVNSIDLLKACFPGGSITGAPKLRAMQIIEELEPHRRNIYCGSIGYINHNGNMDSNISIRTLYTNNNTIYCSAGGAIVFDSEVSAEYQECFDKINILFTHLAQL